MKTKLVRWLLVWCFLGLLMWQPAQAQQDRRLLRQFGKGTAKAVAWSPDGKTIAIGGSLGIWLYPTDLSSPLAHFENNDSEILKMQWRSDGRQIATVDRSGAIDLWDVSSGLVKRIKPSVEKPTSVFVRISYSPDGTELAGITDGNVMIWNTTSGLVKRTLKANPGTTIRAVAWHSDGERLAIGGVIVPPNSEKTNYTRHALLEVWDAQTGNVLSVYKPSMDDDIDDREQVEDVQWVGHGKAIAAQFLQYIRVWNVDGDKDLGYYDEGDVGGSSMTAMAYTSQPDIYAVIRSTYLAAVDFRYKDNGDWFSLSTGFNDISWSPDEHYFCVSGNNGVFVIDPSVDFRGLVKPLVALYDFIGVQGRAVWQGNRLVLKKRHFR